MRSRFSVAGTTEMPNVSAGPPPAAAMARSYRYGQGVRKMPLARDSPTAAHVAERQRIRVDGEAFDRDHPRTSLERMAVHCPRLWVTLARLVRRWPVGSRPRRSMMRIASRTAHWAYNRRDWTALLVNHSPQIELVAPAEFVELGFDPIYRGHAGYIAYQERWAEEWGEFRIEPQEVIDLGDRLLTFGRMHCRAIRSEAIVTTDYALMVDFVAGRAVREAVFLSRESALREAGLIG